MRNNPANKNSYKKFPPQFKRNPIRDLYVPGRILHYQLGKTLKELINRGVSAKHVVDCGCARQPYRKLIEYFGMQYTGIDFDDVVKSGWAPKGTLTLGKDGHWPVETESADFVLSTQVLEHVANLKGYFSEIRRVLRPSGYLILSTHGTMIHHSSIDLWRWTHQGLREVLENEGFKVKKITPLLTTGANLIFLFSQIVINPAIKIFRPIMLIYLLINPIMMLIDRSGRRSVDQLPNMFFALAQISKKTKPAVDNLVENDF